MATITTLTLRSRSFLGHLAVAAAIATLFSAPAASPARAADNNRPVAIGEANGFIAGCFENGGEPDAEVEDDLGFVNVSCDYGDHIDQCNYRYDGTQDCWTDLVVTQPPSGIVDTGVGGVLDGSVSDGGGNGSGIATPPTTGTLGSGNGGAGNGAGATSNPSDGGAGTVGPGDPGAPTAGTPPAKPQHHHHHRGHKRGKSSAR